MPRSVNLLLEKSTRIGYGVILANQLCHIKKNGVLTLSEFAGFFNYICSMLLCQTKTPPQEVIINKNIWSVTSPLEHDTPPAIHKPSKTPKVIARSMANNNLQYCMGDRFLVLKQNCTKREYIIICDNYY